MAIIAVLISMLLPAVQAVREAARRTNCQSNLKQVGLAVLNYESTHDAFPVGIVRDSRHSGLSMLLPFLEGVTVVAGFDDFTIDATGTQLAIFQCPSDDARGRAFSGGAGDATGTFARSNFALNFGKLHAENTLLKDDGPFKIDTAITEGGFKDGMGNTVLVGEVLAGKADRPTGAGDDGDHRGMWGFGGMGANAYTHKFGPNADEGDALLSAGAVPCVESISEMPCGAAAPEWNAVFAAARSGHPELVNVVFGDNHVRGYANETNLSIWQAMSTPAAGEKFVAD